MLETTNKFLLPKKRSAVTTKRFVATKRFAVPLNVLLCH